MARAIVKEEFNVPKEVLWGLIGDFGDMSKWTGLSKETCVAEGQGIGAIRTLQPDPNTKVIDRLEAETEWSYSYSIINPDEAPLPFIKYSATIGVERISDSQSLLVWEANFEPDGLSAEEAIGYTENMYHVAIGMMKRSLASL